MSWFCRLLLLVLLALPLAAACNPGADSPKGPQRRIEPQGDDRQILAIEGIPDPYSPQGQARLRQLARDREEIRRLRQMRRNAAQSR